MPKNRAQRATYTVLNTITPLAQDIVLQVQKLEASKELFDE